MKQKPVHNKQPLRKQRPVETGYKLFRDDLEYTRKGQPKHHDSPSLHLQIKNYTEARGLWHSLPNDVQGEYHEQANCLNANQQRSSGAHNHDRMGSRKMEVRSREVEQELRDELQEAINSLGELRRDLRDSPPRDKLHGAAGTMRGRGRNCTSVRVTSDDHRLPTAAKYSPSPCVAIPVAPGQLACHLPSATTPQVIVLTMPVSRTRASTPPPAPPAKRARKSSEGRLYAGRP